MKSYYQRQSPDRAKRGGNYIFSWTGTPSYVTIEPPLFNTYLEADGYKNVIAMRKKSGKENSPGTEKYTRYLKSFVQMGNKSTENYKNVLGHKIEIVPLQNPYALTLQTELPVQVTV